MNPKVKREREDDDAEAVQASKAPKLSVVATKATYSRSLSTQEFSGPICTFRVFDGATSQCMIAHVSRFNMLAQLLHRGYFNRMDFVDGLQMKRDGSACVNIRSIGTEAFRLFLEFIYERNLGSVFHSVSYTDTIVECAVHFVRFYRLCLLFEESAVTIQQVSFFTVGLLDRLDSTPAVFGPTIIRTPTLFSPSATAKSISVFHNLAIEYSLLPGSNDVVKWAITRHLAVNWRAYKDKCILTEFPGENAPGKVSLQSLIEEYPEVMREVLMHPGLNERW